MTIHKYRKKPVVIEAVMLTEQSRIDIEYWIADNHGRSLFNAQALMLSIQTLEGWITAQLGDFIIKGVKGEFYPCKPDIFEATYDFVPPPSNPVTASRPNPENMELPSSTFEAIERKYGRVEAMRIAGLSTPEQHAELRRLIALENAEHPMVEVKQAGDLRDGAIEVEGISQ